MGPKKNCKHCKGEGWFDGTMNMCLNCRGTGRACRTVGCYCKKVERIDPAVLESLSLGPASVSYLAQFSNAPEAKVCAALKRLANQGLVSSYPGRGVRFYQITAAGNLHLEEMK